MEFARDTSARAQAEVTDLKFGGCANTDFGFIVSRTCSSDLFEERLPPARVRAERQEVHHGMQRPTIRPGCHREDSWADEPNELPHVRGSYVPQAGTPVLLPKAGITAGEVGTGLERRRDRRLPDQSDSCATQAPMPKGGVDA